MTKVTIPETDLLDPNQTLDEDQRKAIDDFKEQDWNADDKDDKTKGDENDDKTKDQEDDSEDDAGDEDGDDSEDAEKAKAEAAENARLEKKAKELDKTVDEVKDLESNEKAEQERIEKVAKDEGITVDEVKENEAKDKSVAERHGNDPVKLARALRKEQSEYGKLKSESDELREFKANAEAQKARFSQEQFDEKIEAERDVVIDKYRAKYPEKSEGVSDDAIFERAKAMIQKHFEKTQKDAQDAQAAKANTQRAELIKSLPAEFKEYIPEVKELLNECADAQVLSDDFDITHLANYARGKKFTPDYIKSLEDAAYKRGEEQHKIVPPIKGGKPAGGKKGSNVSSQLTQEQKDRAREIYGGKDGWSEEQMFKAYIKNDKDNDF